MCNSKSECLLSLWMTYLRFILAHLWCFNLPFPKLLILIIKITSHNRTKIINLICCEEMDLLFYELQTHLSPSVHTSSKSSSSHLIMRRVVLSRIVCRSHRYPSSFSSSSSLSALGLAALCMFCSHSRQCTVQLTRWAWNGTNTVNNLHQHRRDGCKCSAE